MSDLIIIGVVLLILWGIAHELHTRRNQDPNRPCPRCGKAVPAGELDCAHCEFDFRSIGT